MAEHVTLAEAIERGLAHHRAGRLAEAEGIYREILSQAPDEPEVLHLLGFLACQVGQYQPAVELISRAIAINPNRAKFYDNLGNALRALGRPADAARAQLKGLELDPADAEARGNLAVAYVAMRRFDEAEKQLRQVLDEHPDWPEAWNNYAGVLRELRRLNESISACRRAIELKETLAEAHNSLAMALSAQGRQDEAAAAYRKAIELDPTHAARHSNLLMSLHYLPQISPEEIFAEHKKWAALHSGTGFQPVSSTTKATNTWVKNPCHKMRIGYISTDFYGHVISYFIESLLREHDRSQFEIYCYADLANPDATSERLLSLSHGFRLITGIPTETAANLIREDRLDLLVDLGGHTSATMLKILALKPAPVQATYLGYPDTTGLPAVDYRITDTIADPPGWTEAFHTEKLLRLPRCAWCFCPQKEAWETSVAEVDPSRPITFGSFNTLSKVTPWMIHLLADVLKAVPNSRLLLKGYTLGEKETKQRLRNAFAEFGIDHSRLLLHSHQRLYVDHLNLYSQVDIALDCYPYNGTTTTCEALWMGVPVIHLAGKTHVSRVGKSLLNAVGLHDLSSDTRQGYIAAAARLAADRARLKEIRSTLRETMKRSPLMDAQGFARAMEDAYRTMALARA